MSAVWDAWNERRAASEWFGKLGEGSLVMGAEPTWWVVTWTDAGVDPGVVLAAVRAARPKLRDAAWRAGWAEKAGQVRPPQDGGGEADLVEPAGEYEAALITKLPGYLHRWLREGGPGDVAGLVDAAADAVIRDMDQVRCESLRALVAQWRSFIAGQLRRLNLPAGDTSMVIDLAVEKAFARMPAWSASRYDDNLVAWLKPIVLDTVRDFRDQEAPGGVMAGDVAELEVAGMNVPWRDDLVETAIVDATVEESPHVVAFRALKALTIAQPGGALAWQATMRLVEQRTATARRLRAELAATIEQAADGGDLVLYRETARRLRLEPASTDGPGGDGPVGGGSGSADGEPVGGVVGGDGN
jgi:hypothetical protein